MAGLGGLLYGIDLGIIGGALPYLEATSGLTAEQLSAVVAAVLLGSVFSTLFAGMLSDWFGRNCVQSEHSGHRSVAQFRILDCGEDSARDQRRFDWCGGTAISCRVPADLEQGKRDCVIPVVPDAGHRDFCSGGNLL